MTDETVAQIAKRYGCNADEIVRLNKDRVKKLNAKAKLWEGQLLQLPSSSWRENEGLGPSVACSRRWANLHRLVQDRLRVAPCMHRDEFGGPSAAEQGDDGCEHEDDNHRISLGDLESVVKGVQSVIQNRNRTGMRSLALLLTALHHGLDEKKSVGDNGRWRSAPLLDDSMGYEKDGPAQTRVEEGTLEEYEICQGSGLRPGWQDRVYPVVDKLLQDIQAKGSGSVAEVSAAASAHEESPGAIPNFGDGPPVKASEVNKEPEVRGDMINSDQGETEIARTALETVVVAAYGYDASGDDKLTFNAGDRLVLLDRTAEEGWLRARRISPQKAFVPTSGQATSHRVEQGMIPTTRLQPLEAKFDWIAESEDELSFRCGDKLRVLDMGEDEGWLMAEIVPGMNQTTVRRGLVPTTHLETLAQHNGDFAMPAPNSEADQSCGGPGSAQSDAYVLLEATEDDDGGALRGGEITPPLYTNPGGDGANHCHTGDTESESAGEEGARAGGESALLQAASTLLALKSAATVRVVHA